MRAPFALRADGLAPGHIEDLPPECVPRLLTLASGLPDAALVTCVRSSTHPPPARLLERAAYAERRRTSTAAVSRGAHHGCAGARHVAHAHGPRGHQAQLHGLDAGSLLAPLVWLAAWPLAHRLLLQKPFTLSAIAPGHSAPRERRVLSVRSPGRWGLRSARCWPRGTGARPRRPGSRCAGRRARWCGRRSPLSPCAWARIGGSYSPWPLTAFAAYAPLFLAAAGIGALIVAALVLLGTVAKREDP
jgi:hypothetical protein